MAEKRENKDASLMGRFSEGSKDNISKENIGSTVLGEKKHEKSKTKSQLRLARAQETKKSKMS